MGPLLVIFAPALVAAVVFGLYFRAQSHWLADPDAQDYAQLGRQIAAGRGPTTMYMPWNGLAYLAQRDPASAAADPWPNIVRFPLTPLLMAVGFTALWPNDQSAHLPAGLAFVLTAGAAGWLGVRAYGQWAGLAAGLAATFLPLLVNYSLTGLTEPLLGLLIVAMLACVVSRRLVLGGVLLGLAILNRYDTALLALPIVALWLLPCSDRWRASARFLGPAVVAVLPWALYTTVVAGTPLFNLQPASIAAQASGRSDGLGWYLPAYVSPGEIWSRDPSRALRVAWDELAGTPNYLRKLLGWTWLVTGAVACLLALVKWPLTSRPARPRAEERASGPGAEGLRLVVFLLVAVLLRVGLASTLGLNLQRHFVPLVPLLLVIVAGEAAWLVRTIVGRLAGGSASGPMVMLVGQVMVVLALIVPSLLLIGPFLVPPAEPPAPPTWTGEVEARPENLARVAEIVDPGRLIASNVPWSVAWQADRRAIPLPPTVEETATLERRFGISIDAIYVAGQVSIADAPRSWRAWDDLRRRGAPPPGYVLAETFQNGGRLFVKSP